MKYPETRLIKSKTTSRFQQFIRTMLFLVVILAIPTTVWLSQQETNYLGKAFFATPIPVVPQPEDSETEVDPQITLVWPFLGKVGDAVLIQGVGFGDSSKDVTLTMNSVKVPRRNINQWTPELIEFEIPGMPTGTTEGNTVSLEFDDIEVKWDIPFTIYNQTTEIQIKKPNGHLEITNPPTDGSVKMYFDDGTTLVSAAGEDVIVPSGKTIVSLMVLNTTDSPMTFYVEPVEFGF